jgi:uncharacterized membrane protein YeaQ/YmgE (transglycosylase-associated protein family)
MTLQSLLLGAIVATVYGAAFHLWQGGGPRRLALYLLAGWLGFALGHVIGEWLRIDLMRVGPLNLFSATVGAAVALVMARLLVPAPVSPPSTR